MEFVVRRPAAAQKDRAGLKAPIKSRPPNAQYPSAYEINTRVFLNKLSQTLGRHATLDDIPDRELDLLGEYGFQWVWFLGVWQTGTEGRRTWLANLELRRELQDLLPDCSDVDVCGSCFAIQSYRVHSDFGGDSALERLRRRLRERGVRLLLDFVPNHTALDHAWVWKHPAYYVHGSEEQLTREPQNYKRVHTREGTGILACGRDPYFDAWPDTLQLNYAEPHCQEAQAAQLEQIAGLCDGVRCDMAMLVLPQVFKKTWGLESAPFWPEAIRRTRARRPGFLFIAEVYWDLEWTLQQDGFDYTYDKRLYDRLRNGDARPVRDHFRADIDYQRKSVRFLENHDEPRAAAAFAAGMHEAAAVLTYMCPGLRFIHQGQMDGLIRRIPMQLNRGPNETVNPDLHRFYDQLFECLRHPSVQGEWSLLECRPAWEGDGTWNGFIAFSWRSAGSATLITIVNYSQYRGQCYLHIPFEEFGRKETRLRDLMRASVFHCMEDGPPPRGLSLDFGAWGRYVFELVRHPISGIDESGDF